MGAFAAHVERLLPGPLQSLRRLYEPRIPAQQRNTVAGAARNIARSTRSYLAWSVVVAFVAGAGGLGLSTRFLVPTGGAVVLAASLIFFLTLGGRGSDQKLGN